MKRILDQLDAIEAAVPRLTWAYLRTEFYPGDSAWQAARDALTSGPNPAGQVESK
jgi:hypothetical protein